MASHRLERVRELLKRAIGEVNPEIAFYFSFFKTRIHEGLLRERLLATLSGFFGFLSFSAFVFGSLAFLYRKSQVDLVDFCVWLGLLGWTLQGFVEFGLYIPALAWPAFLFLGWLFRPELNSTTSD